MKKLLTIYLCAITFCSLAACADNPAARGGDAREPSPAPQTSAPVEEPGSVDSGNNPVAVSESPVPANEEENQSDAEGGKILMAYFSRVGNTNFDADVDAISSATLNTKDGELVGNNKIVADMIAELTGGDLLLIQTEKSYPSDYRETTDVAMEEQKANARPELSSHVENMDDYDIIILGYPNWWGTIPQAVFTFLEEYDFTEKTIAPFCTHEGSGLGRGVSDIKKLCPDATVIEGLAIRGAGVSNAQKDVEKWLRDLSNTE